MAAAMRWPQIDGSFLCRGHASNAPSIAIGITGHLARLSSTAAPRWKGCIAPSGVRWPSAYTSTMRPIAS